MRALLFVLSPCAFLDDSDPTQMGTNEERKLAAGDWRTKPSELVPPPPREPSARTLQLVHAYAGAQRVMLILGVAFLLGGSLFAVIFCRGIGADAALLIAGEPHKGVVVSSRLRTDIEINGSNPHEVQFRFEYGGKQHTASSTSTSDAFAELAPGDSVDIEVLPSSPELARIEGATSSTFGLWASLILIFPIVGFIFTVKAVLENQREIRAHRVGVPAMATVVFRGLDETTSSNERHPFMVRWEFEVTGKRYAGKLSHMDASLLADLGLNGEIVVLYDPNKPAVNTAYIA